MSQFRVVRGLLIGLAIVFALAICASLGVRAAGAMRLSSATARFEKEVGPLSLLSFVKPRVPEERNAVTFLRPGVSAVILMTKDRSVVGTLATKPCAEWTPKDLLDVAPLLERNEPAFTILRRAQGISESNWEIPYEKGNDAKLPDLLGAMNAGKLVAARGRAALVRGDRETALASTEILGTMASSYQQEASLIVLLIGSALERLQLGLVRELVTAPQVDAAELDRLERSLGRADLDKAFRDTLRGEVAAMIQAIYGGQFDQEAPRVVPRALVVGLGELLVADMLDDRRTLEPSLFGPIKEPLREELRDAGWWKKLVAAYGANTGSARARGIGTLSARELAKLSIGLRRKAIETGAYPASIPTSTDPVSGEPFAFETAASGVRVRSTTSAEILKSIYPVGSPLNAQLYSWTLPAASRSTTPPPSPAARKAASS